MTSKGEKTVFFGPFVGEFGWELAGWHGWVKRLCRCKYANYHKIACSFPGRYPLYPDVDEFWPLPDYFLKNRISSRGYITDCWVKGFPRPDNSPSELPDVLPLVNEVIKKFKEKLPEDTEFIIPWELRYDEDDKKNYGVSIPEDPKSDDDFKTWGIPLPNQILEELRPTTKGLESLEKMVGQKERLIAVFPRHRPFRRPDKSWSRGKYEILTHALQQEFPKFRLAVLGEPGGAFFAEGGVPKDCIDLIQISPEHRLDVQIAALKQSEIAVGGLSGAMYLTLASGCRTLTWGETGAEKNLRKWNYTRTELVYYPATNAPADTIMTYIRWMLGRGKVPLRHEIRRFALTLFYRVMPLQIKKSKTLARLKKSFD